MNGCKTCRWAQWERTATGRMSYKNAGHCLYVVQMPPLPHSVTGAYGYQKEFPRSRIHADMGAGCPTWEERIK